MFDPSLIGRTGTTRHGEHGTITGPASDPARCTFRPDSALGLTSAYTTFTPMVCHITLDEPTMSAALAMPVALTFRAPEHNKVSDTDIVGSVQVSVEGLSRSLSSAPIQAEDTSVMVDAMDRLALTLSARLSSGQSIAALVDDECALLDADTRADLCRRIGALVQACDSCGQPATGRSESGELRCQRCTVLDLRHGWENCADPDESWQVWRSEGIKAASRRLEIPAEPGQNYCDAPMSGACAFTDGRPCLRHNWPTDVKPDHLQPVDLHGAYVAACELADGEAVDACALLLDFLSDYVEPTGEDWRGMLARAKELRELADALQRQAREIMADDTSKLD